MRFFSWYDVQRALLANRNHWPEDWAGVDAGSYGVTIGLSVAQNDPSTEKVWMLLEKWFGPARIDRQQGVFLLDSAAGTSRRLPIFIEFSVDLDLKAKKSSVPLFSELRFEDTFVWNERATDGPPVIAMYSYKGGVGRTLALLVLAKTLVAQAPEHRHLLLVDGDFEAPGLTWLIQGEQGEDLTLSYMDALVMVHGDPEWKQTVLPIISETVQHQRIKIPAEKQWTEHYVLPAVRYWDQLLRPPIRPSDIVYVSEQRGRITDFLTALGKELAADAVLVDLRAGLSDLSAPLLLDPRVKSFIVSTTSEQSVRGTELILKELMTTAKVFKWETTPTILLTMIPDDMDRDKVEQVRSRIVEAATIDDQDEQEYVTLIDEPITVIEVPFQQEMVHMGGLDDIWKKITGTRVEKTISAIADGLGISRSALVDADHTVKKDLSPIERHRALESIRHVTNQLEYAEGMEVTSFLPTSSIRRLVDRCYVSNPALVLMGAKGAGKTFLYLQLLRHQRLKSFVETVAKQENLPLDRKTPMRDSVLIPLLAPRDLELSAKAVVDAACKAAACDLNVPGLTDLPRNTAEKVRQLLRSGSGTEAEWTALWIQQMVSAFGIQSTGRSDDLHKLHSFLASIDRNITFVVDGLENEFQRVRTQPAEQTAISALIQLVMGHLRNIMDSRIGLVVFIRKDMARSAIIQNFGQFEHMYQTFELHWDHGEALRLALWTLCEAGLQELFDIRDRGEIVQLTEQGLEERLYPLWGKKLGPDHSKEAYSARWVLAALSDLRGQLQARDVIRFLQFASQFSITNTISKPWPLLDPASIRQAIQPCGEKKIEEIEKEITSLEEIFNNIKQKPAEKRKIPFRREDLDLTQDEIRQLEEYGIIIEDAGEYYMSEIYRQGLGFTMQKGARPRVLYLLRRRK